MDVMEPYWLKTARNEIGTAEVDGPISNPRIVEYHSFTKLKATDDSIPWCSSFVCFVMETNGIPSTKSAAARSWLDWGVPIEKPQLGCVIVLSRGTSVSSGHVGFFVGETPSHFEVLGGNQKNSVCIMAFPKVAAVGFRLPTEEYWSPIKNGANPSDTRYS